MADDVLPTASGGLCVLDWDNSGRQRTGSRARRGHFSMLIAQLGHITEITATDWMTPNARSPDRADSEARISEVFDEPHTREVLDVILGWVRAA